MYNFGEMEETSYARLVTVTDLRALYASWISYLRLDFDNDFGCLNFACNAN